MSIRILVGDNRLTLSTLPEESVHCVVTSPPYFGLRDYGVDGQIGLEETPESYVQELVNVFRKVRRVLRYDGTVWLNLGDSYARTGGTDRKVSASAKVGSTRNTMLQMGDRTSRASELGFKNKDLMMIPSRVAIALQADGWFLRSQIIWHKPNPMPESVKDRPTNAHESIFLLTKTDRYFYDAEAVKEAATQPDRVRHDRFGGNKYGEGVKHSDGSVFTGSATRNMRNVWTVATKPFKGAHFATFPPDLVEPCIKAGSPSGGIVLDPFGGAGTTGLVANRLGRDAILCELNPEYAELSERRIKSEGGMLSHVDVINLSCNSSNADCTP